MGQTGNEKVMTFVVLDVPLVPIWRIFLPFLKLRKTVERLLHIPFAHLQTNVNKPSP